MAGFLSRFVRRVRFGDDIVIVSGLPRSGTSMLMQMLEAGGIEILTDRVRGADESNPQGYYELERVKELDKGGDPSWLVDARGRAVKIVSWYLRHLPSSNNYKILFMHRDLGEVLASQAQMLERRAEDSATDDGRLRELYIGHLAKAARELASRSCFDVLDLRYGDVLADPDAVAGRVCRFLGGRLDPEAMAATVKPELYRNRSET